MKLRRSQAGFVVGLLAVGCGPKVDYVASRGAGGAGGAAGGSVAGGNGGSVFPFCTTGCGTFPSAPQLDGPVDDLPSKFANAGTAPGPCVDEPEPGALRGLGAGGECGGEGPEEDECQHRRRTSWARRGRKG